jgi:hypothetical protein
MFLVNHQDILLNNFLVYFLSRAICQFLLLRENSVFNPNSRGGGTKEPIKKTKISTECLEQTIFLN